MIEGPKQCLVTKSLYEIFINIDLYQNGLTNKLIIDMNEEDYEEFKNFLNVVNSM